MKFLLSSILLICSVSLYGAPQLREHAVAQYRYTDPVSWPALEKYIPEIFALTATEACLLSYDELHAMAVTAFHFIWNTRTIHPPVEY